MIQLPFTFVAGMEDVQANFETLSLVTAAVIDSGSATLVGGTVSVLEPDVTANTVIRVMSQTLGGTPGSLFVSAKTPGSGFSIKSTSSTDTSTVFYEIVAW